MPINMLWFRSNSASWAYGKLLDRPFNKAIQMWDRKKTEELINAYDRLFQEQLDAAGPEEEIVFGGLQDFVSRELKKSILDSALETNERIRKQKREQVYEKAYEACSADTEAKKNCVRGYLDTMYGFIRVIAEERVDQNTKIMLHAELDAVDQKHSQMAAEIQADLEQLKNREKKSDFAEMIGQIAPKPESQNEFHYLNRSIGFWGREKEMAALGDFLRDDRKVLFLTIAAPGGSGKSKLAHEFVKQNEGNQEWDMKYPGKAQIGKLLSFGSYPYPRNLLLIVDSAGLYAKQLGEWLYHLVSLDEAAHPEKIRLILLERMGKIEADCGDQEASWRRDLLGYGEQREALTRIHYHADAFTPDDELKPLGEEALRRIMIQYGENHNRPLQPEETDRLMGFLKKIDPKGGSQSNPLFALIIAEAYVNRMNVLNWNREAMLEHCIRRTETQWEYLCRKNEDLLASVKTMMLYATATEGLNLDAMPACLTAEKRCLDDLGDEDYIELVCGINQDSRFQGELYPMEPDLVGEYYLLQYFRKAGCRKEKLKKTAGEYWEKTQNFFNVMVRCIQDYGNDRSMRDFLLENCDLLLPPDRNDLEVEAHSRLLHVMLVNFTGKRYEKPIAQRLKELHEKYPDHKVVTGDYAASLMLDYKNHFGNFREQDKNVEEIGELLAANPDSYYLLLIYGKSIYNQIVSYHGYFRHCPDPSKKQACASIINNYMDELIRLVKEHPDHEYLKRSFLMAKMLLLGP